MPTWQDIEDVMAYWYREGDFNAWADLAEIQQDQGDLSAIRCCVADTFLPEERSILADMHEELCDLLAYTADELKPRLRLAAADRRANKSLAR